MKDIVKDIIVNEGHFIRVISKETSEIRIGIAWKEILKKLFLLSTFVVE